MIEQVCRPHNANQNLFRAKTEQFWCQKYFWWDGIHGQKSFEKECRPNSRLYGKAQNRRVLEIKEQS